MSKKALIVINPRAGKMTFRNSFYPVVKHISDAGFDVEVHFTSHAGDATDVMFTKGADKDLIVICGGDGTFNEAVNGFIRAGLKAQLGYIPCGSTNDFAATLGIVGTPAQITDQILKNELIVLDAGKFNDRYFTYTASFGAFTAISYDTPQNLKNTFGHFAYMLNATKQIGNLPRVKLKITADDYSEEGVYIYGGITNTTSIGGLYTLPEDEVDINDGLLELLLIREPKHPQEYAETLFNLAIREYDDPNILFRHAKQFELISDEELAFTLDGEYGGADKVHRISCVENAYAVNGKQK